MAHLKNAVERRPPFFIRRLAYLLLFGAIPAFTAPPRPVTTANLTAAAREIADRAATKVVVLKTARTKSRGSASAFMVLPGLAVTAGHAVSEQHRIVAWVNGVSYPAQLLAKHPAHDVALLRLSAPKLHLKPLELAERATDLQIGEELIILAGNSQPRDADGDPRSRAPLPASFDRWERVRDADGRSVAVLTLNASVLRGDSGSPVLRVRDGNVVGLLTSRDLPGPDGVSRTAYAIPVEAMRDWIEETARTSSSGKFYLFELNSDL